jgi:hypothetical protein
MTNTKWKRVAVGDRCAFDGSPASSTVEVIRVTVRGTVVARVLRSWSSAGRTHYRGDTVRGPARQFRSLELEEKIA